MLNSWGNALFRAVELLISTAPGYLKIPQLILIFELHLGS